MERSKCRDLNVCEKHHIIPKSLGGNNFNDNIARLTPREHFIAHALLTKMTVDPRHKKSMSYAFVRMKVSNNKSGYNRIGNGKLYESIKTSIREHFCGVNNPFYGDHRFKGENNPFYKKTHSDDLKRRFSDQRKGKNTGSDNHFFGKTHTDGVKSMISSIQSEPVIITFDDGRTQSFKKKTDIGSYLGVCASLGVQLCSRKKHLWKKYNIRNITQ